MDAGRVIDNAGRTDAGQAPAQAGSEADPRDWRWGDDNTEPPLDAALPDLVAVTSRLLATYWWCASRGTGVSPAGIGILRLLAARGGLKSSEVARLWWSTPGTVTSVVDTLVRDRLAERRRDPADRRVVRLYATELGRQKLAESLAQMGQRWSGAFDYVDAADEPVIRKFLVETIERFGTLVREERNK